MPISTAESRIMEILWEHGSLSAEEIIQHVPPATGWSNATVKTLINRLLRKKAVSAQREGRKSIYTALISRDEYVESESRDLLDRLFNGKLAPLVSHFTERGKISETELAELKALLENTEEKDD